MPDAVLTTYLNSLGSVKLLKYQGVVKGQTLHVGVNFPYDHQGSFTGPGGKTYHNVQIQLSKRVKAKSLKGMSRPNSTSPSAACVMVATTWTGDAAVLRNALEESAQLGDEDGCRKIWLYENGTTKPQEAQPSKGEKLAAERKANKENKKAGDTPEEGEA